MLYLIQIVPNGPVKVGYSKDVTKRLGVLQSAVPYQLELLHSCKGGLDDETDLLERLHPFHLKREWFLLPSEVIERLKSWPESRDDPADVPDGLLSSRQAARYLNVTRRELWQIVCRTGTLPCQSGLLRSPRFERAMLDTLLGRSHERDNPRT